MTTEPTLAPGMGRCEITGKILPEDELVLIQGKRVCAEGKALLLEQLKAGENLPNELERPSVGRRFGAYFLDGLVLMIPVMIFSVVPAFLAASYGMTVVLIVQGICQILTATIAICYYGLMHGSRGQSLGKMAAKLKVVREDGQPISMKTGFLRAFAYQGPGYLGGILAMTTIPLISQIGSFIVLGYVIANILSALFDRSQQRAIHDRLAGTRVVVVNK